LTACDSWRAVPGDVFYLLQNGSVIVNPFGANTGVSEAGDALSSIIIW